MPGAMDGDLESVPGRRKPWFSVTALGCGSGCGLVGIASGGGGLTLGVVVTRGGLTCPGSVACRLREERQRDLIGAWLRPD